MQITQCDHCKKTIPRLPPEQTEAVHVTLSTGNKRKDGRYDKQHFHLCDEVCLMNLLKDRATK